MFITNAVIYWLQADGTNAYGDANIWRVWGFYRAQVIKNVKNVWDNGKITVSDQVIITMKSIAIEPGRDRIWNRVTNKYYMVDNIEIMDDIFYKNYIRLYCHEVNEK